MLNRYLISLIIVLLFPYLGYCESKSNHSKKDEQSGQTCVNVSIDTLNRMISNSLSKDLTPTLNRISKKLQLLKKNNPNLKGFRFFYSSRDSKEMDCNIYARFTDTFETAFQKQVMMFKKPNNSCSGMLKLAFVTYNISRNSANIRLQKGKPVKMVSGEMPLLIDPLSSNFKAFLETYPELEPILKEKGFDWIRVPLLIGRSPVAAMTPFVEATEIYGKQTTWSVIWPYNKDVVNPESMGADMELNFPVPFLISKQTINKADSYLVKRGDTLEKIADKFYGDKKLWGLIYLINKDDIVTPEQLKAHSKLIIPNKQELSLPEKYSFATFMQVYLR